MSDPLFFIDKNPEDEENIGMKKERRKKIHEEVVQDENIYHSINLKSLILTLSSRYWYYVYNK